MGVVDKWLSGKKISDEDLQKAIANLAKYGEQTTIGKYAGKEFITNVRDYVKGANPTFSGNNYTLDKVYDQYDYAILGLTNYWNDRLGLIGTKDEIDANVIKAMIMTESGMGTLNKKDVMASLSDVPKILAYGTNERTNYPMTEGGYALFRQMFDSNGDLVSANANPLMSIAGGIRISRGSAGRRPASRTTLPASSCSLSCCSLL